MRGEFGDSQTVGETPPEGKSLDKLLAVGSEMAGQAAGATIGFLAGGPEGALVGGASAPLMVHSLRSVAAEIKRRVLGPREETRVGAALVFAARKIDENLRQGMKIRDDDFFRGKPSNRAAAHEILEGVLLAAQKEYEERKLPYYGNLLANIAFHKEIDRAQGNLLLRVASSLSYRQLCILSLLSHREKLGLRQKDYRGEGIQGLGLIGILQETFDLYQQGMLNCSGEVMLGLTDVNPGKTTPQGMGAVIAQLMELHRIPEADIKPIADRLA